MERFRSYTTIGGVIVFGMLLQLLFIWADGRDTPGKSAERFAEAYYRLDPGMGEFLCEKNAAMTEAQVVEKYIRGVRQEADLRGYDLSFMKQMLYGVETHTRRIDDVTAEVRITGKRRTSINPVYALVAKFFRIGEAQAVDEVVTVVKENSRWKVCGTPFQLMSDSSSRLVL